VAVAKKSRLGQAICKAGLRLTHSGHEGDVKQSIGQRPSIRQMGIAEFLEVKAIIGYAMTWDQSGIEEIVDGMERFSS